MTEDVKLYFDFVKESNAIEGIYREPSQEELDEFARFIKLPKITIDEIIRFVSVYEPTAQLRDKYDMNVRVGSYIPPFGGPDIRKTLDRILSSTLTPWEIHAEYEHLHPFTDCNGRSGRALWAAAMPSLSGGFLLNFYYQTLGNYSSMFDNDDYNCRC